MHQPDELTYVVLDVPEPQASAITAIRQQHGDLFRAALPVDITLTESFYPAQDPTTAFAVLDSVASHGAPIRTSFAGAHRFANSDTFVMLLRDEEPFRALRDELLEVELAFLPSQHSFIPHCTLRTRSPVSEQEARELLATEVAGEIVLETLSVYTLKRAATPAGVVHQLRHRVRLGTSTRAPAGRR